ncbi:MAG: hypothetical protein D6757_06855 [Alphaproteobacteria bacterium]|nr:MAG: hypothetical protein D6757_06855 [Alphaproteobacteria bacterium]
MVSAAPRSAALADPSPAKFAEQGAEFIEGCPSRPRRSSQEHEMRRGDRPSARISDISHAQGRTHHETVIAEEAQNERPDPVMAMIDALIDREGGFSNHADDRGGATKYGITRTTLAAWRGMPVETDDVRNLSIDEARRIYRARYVEEPGIERLPFGLRAPMFDAAVLHGPGAAVRLLQYLLRRIGEDVGPVDGRIGTRTITATLSADARWGERLVASLAEERRRLIYRLVRRDPTQRVFVNGWLARIDRLDPLAHRDGQASRNA